MTEADRVVYMRRLAEAQEAYHTLTIGGQARVVVEQNGERVEFFASRRQDLRTYILELKSALGLPLDISGPMTVGIC